MARPSVIDAEVLERMERIARGFPGSVVSVRGRAAEEREERQQAAVLRIDGVSVGDILERYRAGVV